MVPHEEVRESNRGVHRTQPWVDWAEPHSPHCMVDRYFRLAHPCPHPSAILPRPSEIHVECECSLNESGTIVKVTCEHGKHESGRSECIRVIPAQLSRPASQLLRLLDLGQGIGHPPVSHACFKAHRRRRMGKGI